MLETRHSTYHRLYSFFRVLRPGAPLCPDCGTQDITVQIELPLVIGSSFGLQMNPHHKVVAMSINEPDHEVEIMSPLPVVVG